MNPIHRMNLRYTAPAQKIMFICTHCGTAFCSDSYSTRNSLAIGTCPHCWQETSSKL